MGLSLIIYIVIIQRQLWYFYINSPKDSAKKAWETLSFLGINWYI